MKRVIDRKVYDTETAEQIHSWESMDDSGNFHYYTEDLYVTKKGNFFIAGEGGAMSPYSESLGSGSYGGGSGIQPVSLEEAIEWLERHGGDEILSSDERFSAQLEEA